jgi:hypothetical protein
MFITINVKGADGAMLAGSSLVLTEKTGYGGTTLEPNGGAGVFIIDTLAPPLSIPDLSQIDISAMAPGYASLYVSGANLQPNNDIILAKASTFPLIGIAAIVAGLGYFAYKELAGKKKR